MDCDVALRAVQRSRTTMYVPGRAIARVCARAVGLFPCFGRILSDPSLEPMAQPIGSLCVSG
eukprot:14902521-Heterocapsa_arctica.AAC.1